MDWWKEEAYENVIGPYNLQNMINQMAAKYKTNIIVSKINPGFQTQSDNYTVEVWYNFDSRGYLINVFKK